MNKYEFIEALLAAGFVERELKQFHYAHLIIWVGYKQVVIIHRHLDIASIIETTVSNGELDFNKALDRVITLRNIA